MPVFDLSSLLGTIDVLAGIGPGSSTLEVVATSVGAGILLGGFVAGTAAWLGRRRANPDRVADAGYFGGWLAALVLLVDLVLRLG